MALEHPETEAVVIATNASMHYSHVKEALLAGKHAFVGAGALINKNVPDYALMVGVPARRVAWMCECGIRLDLEDEVGACLACGNSYQLDTSGRNLAPLDPHPSPGPK